MKSPHAALVLSGVLLACSGCQGGPAPVTEASASSSMGTPSAPVTASAVPSPQCTPELGGPASPCTQQQYDDMKAKDAQYAEAERVYRALTAEDLRLTLSGEQAPNSISEYLAEPALSTFKTDHALQHSKGITASGSAQLIGLQRVAASQISGAEIALYVCIDGSGLTLRSSKNVSLGAAKIVHAIAGFKTEAGKLKAFAQKSEEVSKC